MRSYLSLVSYQDFRDNIPDLPPNFIIDNRLYHSIDQLARTWLVDLIGIKTLTDVANDYDNGVPTATSQQWAELIAPFLVLAAWSEYIIYSNITMTRNGPVEVALEGSDPISKDDRLSYSRLYRSRAERAALELSKKSLSNQCGSSGSGSGRPTITAAGGKRRSRFDN